jgi:iron-sulfur cluster assembly protein|tara:strand:+ start:411 stop:827 length:417 start_codon:yes stop_codon:yes gene_type:complete
MVTNQVGCELKISEKAANIFKEMIVDENKNPENSYLRVGANSGGCSGWKFSLDFEDTVDSVDLIFEQYDVKLVVDKTILNDIIGDVEVDYKVGNLVEQGFMFKRLKYAHVCGCGESFTPVKDIPADGKQQLGWKDHFK